MAVTKLSNSGIKTGVLKYDSMLAGNPAFDPAATWLIQRVAGTGSSGTITFSSIPSTYQHLQIRYMVRTTEAVTTPSNLHIRVNGDTGSNYTQHELRGDGSAAAASGSTTTSVGGEPFLRRGTSSNSMTASIMGVGIIDILDYASTSKTKTIRSFYGLDFNTASTNAIIGLNSHLWNSTSAINSFTLQTANTGSIYWTTSSTFALYGIKGV